MRGYRYRLGWAETAEDPISALRAAASAAYNEAAEAYREAERCEGELAAERAAHDATRAELGAALLAVAALERQRSRGAT